MGLLSKIFGSDEAAKQMLDQVKQMFTPPQDGITEPEPEPPKNGYYGRLMPSEPNQFNYSGNYVDYFSGILREEFTQYSFNTETVRDGTGTVLTLFENGRKALVIELMTERCSSKKLRKECAAEGTPYLRFYYDHAGWWNVRSYVVGRIRTALKI